MKYSILPFMYNPDNIRLKKYIYIYLSKCMYSETCDERPLR